MTDQHDLPELYQAEWCPHSQKVRTRLTELEIDVTLRQVEPEAEQRSALRARTGQDSIPILVLADGTSYAGSEEILPFLDSTWEGGEPASAAAHRKKAESVRIEQLEQGGA